MMVAAYIWIAFCLICIAFLVYQIRKDARAQRKSILRDDIERLEQELDLDDTCKTKQPKAPKPMKFYR
jgi:heme exporter protein D